MSLEKSPRHSSKPRRQLGDRQAKGSLDSIANTSVSVPKMARAKPSQNFGRATANRRKRICAMTSNSPRWWRTPWGGGLAKAEIHDSQTRQGLVPAAGRGASLDAAARAGALS
jgi:peptidoglycan/xylan/chitin deacetylase (PgdA/CDA1 family)